MRKWRYGILLSLILVGCTATTPDYDYHPRWPAPYTPCEIEKPLVVENNNKVYIAWSLSSSVDQGICDKDKLRLIKELNTIVCHYRKGLEEPRCKEQYVERK